MVYEFDEFGSSSKWKGYQEDELTVLCWFAIDERQGRQNKISRLNPQTNQHTFRLNLELNLKV